MSSFGSLRRRTVCLAAAFPLLGALAITAQQAVLVRDLRPGIDRAASPNLYEAVGLGGRVVFGADDGVTGVELWSTDGTARGTQRIADLCPGPCSGTPTRFVVAGDQIFFYAVNSLGRTELWRTDGTEDGTHVLPHPEIDGFGGSYPLQPFGVRSILFAARTRRERWALWSSDGTVAGTRMIVDRNPGPEGSTFERLRSFLGRLVLYDRGVGYDLVSDGTSLQPFIDVYPFLADFGLRGIEIGGKALVNRFTPPNHVEPWITDGTAAGTVPLLGDLAEGLGFEASGDRLLFVRSEGDTQSTYFSNGTPEGTQKIATGVVPSFEFNRVPFSQAGARWVFSAVRLDDGARAIWATDGTPEGTGPVLLPTDEVGLPNRAAPFAGRLLLAGRALWITDGTPAGTEIVIEPDGFFGDAPLPVVAGDRAFYSRFDEETGQELWALRP